MSAPPPTIATDRVLHYAILPKSIPCTPNHGLLYVDGNEIGKVPALAICESRQNKNLILHYCDKDWDSIAVSVHGSVDSAKLRAERIYPGSMALWRESNFSEEDAEKHLDRLYKDFHCSFCGKRGDLALQMFTSDNPIQPNAPPVHICADCVSEFNSALSNNSPTSN